MPKEEWKLSPTTHESIIDSYIFNKANLLLKTTRYIVKKVGSNDHLYLLSGLIKCDNCQEMTINSETIGMVGWHGSKKKLKKGIHAGKYTYSYICERKKVGKHSEICEAMPLPAEQLEEYVVNYTKELLKNPIAVYNHQSKLKSTKKHLEQLRKRKEDIKKLINGIPFRIDRLKEQHELGITDTPTLEKEVMQLKLTSIKYQLLLAPIDRRIGESHLSQEYLTSLELFSQKYLKTLDDLYSNRKEIFDILHILIERIIVYSREVTKKDVLAGRKKQNQRLPYRLELRLRLPQDILQQLGTKGFGVKSTNL